MYFLSCKIIVFLFLAHFIFAQDVQVFPTTNTVNLEQFQLLVINLNQPTEISLNCSILEALSQDSFSNDALCLNGALPNSTDWSIQTPFVVLPSSVSFATLTIALNTSPASRLIQTLVVWCCNGVNLNASARVDVDVQPNIARNNNFSVPARVSLFPNPAYQNIAPCQCDLDVDLCDTDCCCDVMCTPEEQSTFQCIPGMFGGNFTTDDPQLCTTQQFDVPDYHQFTCIQRLNSPDLGLFFANVTGRQSVLTTQETDALLASATDFVFPSVSNTVQEPMQTTPYRNGDPIIIEILLNGTIIFGYLTLPQTSLSGQCLQNALVPFQNDSFAYCDVTVTTLNCAEGSILDFNNYVTNTTSIKSTPGGENANVNVTYRKDTSTTNYVKTNTGAASSSGVSLFNFTGSTGTIGPATNVVSPTVAGATCNNAVVSVTYFITWEGNRVTNVDVDVILADVPLTGTLPAEGTPPDNILSQSFTVRSSFINPPTVQRSGNPGYDVGLPVISGNQTVPNAIVDTTQEFKIWQPDSSGLCAQSGTAAPSFGQDMSTGCLLRLSKAEFGDCAALRSLVENNQRVLIPSGALVQVARFGNPNTTSFDSADWTSNVNITLSQANITNNTIPSQCDNIPSQVHIEFVTSLSGRIEGFPITEIVAVRVSWVRETWKLQCGGVGACTDGSATENFAVYSIVTFSSVPVTGTTTTNECDGDATCWPELLLPLRARFYSSQPTLLAERDFEYNLGWSLVVIYFALGAALLSLNWGKVGEAVLSAFPV
uniref:Tectonic-2-like n=1 Tax=Phallusia mammillata TaxID=59560 RepID=A0A6F9DV73_9ASCI|nr:tectonic-2-like [Phallusia mammillata]